MSIPSIFFAVVLTFTGFAQAHATVADSTDEIRTHVYRAEDTQYVLAFKESSKWKFQVFKADADGFDDLVVDEELGSFNEARARHQAYLKSIGYTEAFDDGSEADMAVMASQEPEAAASASSADSLWEVTADWTDAKEIEFSRWVSSEVDTNFFKRYGIATDCADVVIGANWIFAYMNGLPIANTLSGSGRMVGQMTMRPEWRDLPRAAKWYENQQFLTALNYVMSATYTKSLGRDSYPIRIDRNSVIPGTHHLEFHEVGGHAQLVKEVRIRDGKSALVRTLNSTLPVKVRTLIMKDYVFGDQPTEGTGFLRVKRVVRDGSAWKFKAAERHSTYSREQYEPEFMNGLGVFSMAVNAHLCGNLELNIPEWKNTLKMLENSIADRVAIVKAGFAACQASDCGADRELYDEHSTPGRDDTLKRLIRGIVNTVNIHQTALPAYRTTANKNVVYDRGQSMTVDEVIRVFLENKYDSDPRSPIAKRWGR